MLKPLRQISLFILFLTALTSGAYGEGPRKILVLHSYHQGFEWTDNINEGIKSILSKSDIPTELYYEYLDTKRDIRPGRYESFRKEFHLKYPQDKFEIVIAVDNNALNFINNFGKFIFNETPVVFCGINNFSYDLVTEIDNVTGVVENTDYIATIELMLEFNPERNKILVILDSTKTSQEIKKEFQNVESFFEGRVLFDYLDDFQIEDVKGKIEGLGVEYLIYLVTFNLDKNNKFISYKDGLKIIKGATDVPIYGSWDYYVGKGIIGGIITSGFSQGETAASLTQSVLSGTDIQNIPIILDSPNKCMIDYSQLRKYGIDTGLLPEKCLVINLPPTFYEKYQKTIFSSAIAGLLLFVTLLFYLRYQRNKERFLIKVNTELDNIVKEKTTELLNTNEKLNKIIDTAPSPVFYKNKEGVYRGCNDAFADIIIGLPKERIIGSTLYDLPGSIPTMMAKTYRSKDMELLEKPGSQVYEAKVKCADALYRDYLINKATLTDSGNMVTGIVGVMIDISHQKKTEGALKESKERFKRLLDASFGGIAIHDRGLILDVNKALSDLTGYSIDELVGMNGLQLIAPEWWGEVRGKVNSDDEARYDVEGIKKDGTRYPLEIQAKLIPYEGRTVRVTGFRDISERILAQEERERLIRDLRTTNKELKKLSVTDSLTGISNRGYIIERFIGEVRKAERYRVDLSIILLDIDKFKTLNDTYGHPFGDQVLRMVSNTIKSSIREIDLVGRYGGEEFLVILPNTNIEQGFLLAERVRKNIELLTWDHENLVVTISGGVAQYFGESENALLKYSDDLLYRAKSKGRNRIEKP